LYSPTFNVALALALSLSILLEATNIDCTPGTVRVTLVSCTEDAPPLVRSGNLTVWSPPKLQERFLSNDVRLEVVPTDEARLGVICEALTQQAIAARRTDEGLQAAEALSWIDLPLAEPFLERLLPLEHILSHEAVVVAEPN
jgi:hypothetical protein